MTTSKPKVLITGASGLIGGLVVNSLGDTYDFSAVNRRPAKGILCLQADIADFDAILPAFAGMDMVLHLSAYTEDVNEWGGARCASIWRERTTSMRQRAGTKSSGSCSLARAAQC